MMVNGSYYWAASEVGSLVYCRDCDGPMDDWPEAEGIMDACSRCDEVICTFCQDEHEHYCWNEEEN